MKRLTLIVLFALLITGCVHNPPPSWTKTYAGVERPQNEMVELFHHFTNYSEVLEIDGVAYTKTRIDSKLYYNMLPGIHEIKYKLRWRKKGYVMGLISVDMKAGHRYTLRHTIHFDFLIWGQSLTVMLKDDTADEFLYSRTYSKPTLYGYWPSHMDLQMEKRDIDKDTRQGN